MKRSSLTRSLVAVLVALFMLCQGTWALAGTTGGLNGTVTDDNGASIAGADVKVVSASQSAATVTDGAGHFTFLSLAPDTYTVSIEKNGFNPVSYAGVVVFADNQQALSFKMNKALKEIAKVSARASGALVKAGTTSDVYSVNAATAAKVTGLGGGGSLDQAYSAIATMPGAYVPVGGAGWYQSVFIRGGDVDQVGYEVDGVPVNRSFDNYPSSTASALGQQEVQVYTGSSPANSESQGLSGYINQVIKTGTYPGFATSDLALGFPQFYHKANIEVGGASPDRLFSYYAGFGGYNQDHRAFDQSNGASISSTWGTPVTDCGTANASGLVTPGFVPSCYDSAGTLRPYFEALGPYIAGSTPDFSDRENVVNFHFGIPHHHDGGRDDLQILWQASDIQTYYSNSPNDYGGMLALLGAGPACFVGGPRTCVGRWGLQYGAPIGGQFTSNAALQASSPVVPYYYPSTTRGAYQVAANGAELIPGNSRDGVDNAVGIVKLQYQKNFGSDAYLRIYGYTLFSNWFNWGPNTAWQAYAGAPGYGPPFDYELSTHTRGISATFAKQLNSRNLLTLQGSYLTATSLRDNNTQMTRSTSSSLNAAVQVSSANPYNGVCYSAAGAATACSTWAGGAPLRVSLPRLWCAQQGATASGCSAVSGAGTLPALAASCGGAPCEWVATDTGMRATYNTVTPKFAFGSITDEWNPTDRLHLNLGLRWDSYQFVPSNTNRTQIRQMYFNSWNNVMCYDTTNRLGNQQALTTPVTGGPAAVTTACQAAFGPTFAAATISPNSFTQTFTVLQPRLGATYTVNPLNVLRFSYGKYDQAPNTAFEQYDALQSDLPQLFASGKRGGFNFFAYGRTAPTYPIRPQISYNGDFSWEHQFKGTDMSFKITPFYRRTQDQIERFYLDLATSFVSGLNVGALTSKGVEFQLQKGDFSRNGLAALFSYTYTNAQIRYSDVTPGNSLIDPINQQIAGYNAYTQTCATTPTAAGCQFKGSTALPTNSLPAAPCYTPAGAPDPACAAGSIANPYWNDKPRQLLDPHGQLWPSSNFPSTINAASYGSYVVPHVATLVLNYKHDKWSVTPAWQFSAGSRYGYPLSTLGVDPAAGCSALAGVAPITSRNPYTNASGLAYDANSCGPYAAGAGGISIPNPDTNAFDGFASFIAPSRLTMSTQFTYEMNNRMTAVVTLANIFDTCFGGTKAAWTNVPGVAASKVCGYGGTYAGLNPVGNGYNPASTGAAFTPVQTLNAHSYAPGFGSLPFNAFVDLKIKL